MIVQPWAWSLVAVELVAQPAGPQAHLQDPERQGDRGFILAADVHQVAAHNPVWIHDEVVEALAARGGARNWPDGFGHVEDRDKTRPIPEALSQALLIGAYPLIAVDV